MRDELDHLHVCFASSRPASHVDIIIPSIYMYMSVCLKAGSKPTFVM